MTPKQKAEKLFNNFIEIQAQIEWGDERLINEAIEIYERNGEAYSVYWKELAKQSALILADEMISTVYYTDEFNYWQLVRTEIESL